MMLSIIDDFINRRSLEDGNALLGGDCIFIFHYNISLPVAPVSSHIRVLLCISAGAASLPPNDALMGVCSGAGSSMGRCHRR